MIGKTMIRLKRKKTEFLNILVKNCNLHRFRTEWFGFVIISGEYLGTIKKNMPNSSPPSNNTPNIYLSALL